MRPVNTLPKSPHLQSKRNPDQYFDQNNNGSTFTGYNQTGILSQNNNHLNTSYLMAPGGMDKRKCVKLLMLGQDGVGKSAFVVRYLTRRYIGEYDPKIEGIFRKTVNMNNQDINVEIKDTSRGINWSGRANDLIWTNGLICVYSINNRSSFNEIQSISKMLLQQKKSRGIPCLLIGNKKDLEKNERRVQVSEGQQLADSINGTFCELSVSDGYIELENIVNKFIKDKCSDLKNHLLPQSKILSSKSTPEIRKPLGGGQGGSNDGGGVDIEVKTEKKTRALWQKLLTNNNKKQ
uniref:small monomeric GTPase n=2 Tax=Clytia hemisphaerica TaxID=252671 RepID=A0A7M5XLF6_9CNID